MRKILPLFFILIVRILCAQDSTQFKIHYDNHYRPAVSILFGAHFSNVFGAEIGISRSYLSGISTHELGMNFHSFNYSLSAEGYLKKEKFILAPKFGFWYIPNLYFTQFLRLSFGGNACDFTDFHSQIFALRPELNIVFLADYRKNDLWEIYRRKLKFSVGYNFLFAGDKSVCPGRFQVSLILFAEGNVHHIGYNR
jgi:hypothetical protein